jgi:hypothetical protein
MTDQSVIFILSNINDLIMNQITIQKQQHSLAKKQVSRESAREVSNLLQKNQYTAADLAGLSWVLFEEDL